MGKEELYQTVQEENRDPIATEISGTIPEWIEGSLYRNGPAKFEFGKTKYKSWFDGMAMVHRFRISKGTVTYQNRFIESDTYRKNMKADRIVVTEFGTIAYSDPCKSLFERFFCYFRTQEPTDNTFVSLFPVGKSLYACTETNLLNQIDLEDLSRLKKVDLTKIASVSSAAAHPHVDLDENVHMLSAIYGRNTSFAFLKVTPPTSGNGFCEKAEIVSKIPAQSNFKPSYFHSFAMTENYYVFIETPLVVNVFKILTSKVRKVPFNRAIEWDTQFPVKFHIMDRSTGEKVNKDISYQSEPFFTFHNINAYEENGQIILDTVVLDKRINLNDMLKEGLSLDKIQKGEVDHTVGLGLAQRFILPLEVDRENLNTNLVKLSFSDARSNLEMGKDKIEKEVNFIMKCHPETISESVIELPQINYKNYNTKKYRFVYGIGRMKMNSDSLVRIDTESKVATHWYEEGVFQSEPIFVASPNAVEEDDGVILSVGLTTGEQRHAFLLVLDAKNMNEIGRAKIDVKIGVDIHGYFVNDA